MEPPRDKKKKCDLAAEGFVFFRLALRDRPDGTGRGDAGLPLDDVFRRLAEGGGYALSKAGIEWADLTA